MPPGFGCAAVEAGASAAGWADADAPDGAEVGAAAATNGVVDAVLWALTGELTCAALPQAASTVAAVPVMIIWIACRRPMAFMLGTPHLAVMALRPGMQRTSPMPVASVVEW